MLIQIVKCTYIVCCVGHGVQIQIEIFKSWCVLPIWMAKSNVLSVGPSSDREILYFALTLETLDFAFYIGTHVKSHSLFLSVNLTGLNMVELASLNVVVDRLEHG